MSRYTTRTVIYDCPTTGKRMMVRLPFDEAKAAKDACRNRFGPPLRTLARGERSPPAILNRPEPF